MRLQCFIIDDDLMARTALENLCEKSEYLQVAAVCESGEEALELMENTTADLLFLDIEMPGLSGLEFLDRLTGMPQVVITSGKKEYAFDAFEYQVTDFLAKPITLARFEQAVEKAVFNHRQQLAYRQQSGEIYIRHKGKLVRLEYSDIQYFENVGDYVRVQTSRQSYVIFGTLRSIAGKLQDPRFFRVHRSFLVNMDKIREIEENNLVIGEKLIPISRNNRPVLLSRINLL